MSALFERQPPQSPEAEMSLLGSMILDPAVIPDVIGLLKGPEDFYREAHGHIYKAVLDVYDQRHSGDLVQIVDLLRDRAVIDQIGGPEYLVELANAVPTAVNAPHFARIVAEKAKLRRLIDAAGQILYDAYHVGELGPEGAREVLDKAETSVFEIAQEQNTADPQSLADLLQIEIDRILAADRDGWTMTGLRTGYGDLDELLRGLQPGELIILAARPSMGKCLDAASEIVMEDGSIATIEEVCRRMSGRVPTLGVDFKLGTAAPSAFVDDGRKPVFEVTTRLGRRVRTTLTHPFLTIDGWRALGELSVGDHVAVARKLPIFGAATMRECEVKLLGYLIGDGGLTNANPRFTNSNVQIAREFAECVEQFGGVRLSVSSTREWEAPSWRVRGNPEGRAERRIAFGQGLATRLSGSGKTARKVARELGVSPASITHWIQGKTAPDAETFARLCVVLEVKPDDLAPGGLERIRTNQPNALTAWLNGLGLMGEGAAGKHVPASVFTLRRELVALFLNRLFATDGWATVLASGQTQLGYASVSERLARQVQHLLLRLGVIASLRQRWVKYKESRRPSWQLDITDADSIRTFAREVGIFGKEEALQRAVAAVNAKRYQTNRDLVPVGVWRRIAAAKGALSWRQLAMRVGAKGENLHVGKRAPTRARLARIAAAVGDRRLADLADSDVYWDRIVSIEPLGERQVYDLTVPGTHNFVAEDVCVHNTALALNLAEQIAMGGVPVAGAAATHAVPVGLFSLEMSKNAIVQRLLSARAGVSSQQLRGGHPISKHDLHQLGVAADDLKQAPIYIDDLPNLTVLNLRARARRMVAQYGVKVIMIDYLQLMSAPGSARESRQVEVSAISRGVKALARELNIPVVCLSQLNRASEQREGNRPRMADLRESGSIEQDADVILLLHREDYYHVQDEDWKIENPDKVGVAEIIVAKQRNGPTDVVKLKWDARTTRFKNFEAHAQAPGGYPFDDYSTPSQAAGGRGGVSEPKPWTRSAPPPFEPGAGSAFGARPKTGPVEGHRDGGGSDQRPALEDEEPA